MILQALADQYEALAQEGKIAEPGWCDAKVSLAAELSEEGELLRLFPLLENDGKKDRPRILKVPEQVKKTSGIAANFLCDNGTYLLGIDTKGKPERARLSFQASSLRHHEILDGVDNTAANSILRFFDQWNPSEAEHNEKIQEYLPVILGGGNIVFFVNGRFAHEETDIRKRWMECRASSHSETGTEICLISGKRQPSARLHDSIKGIVGAQSSGASLVSYNAPAFESYGHEQGENAPVSISAMLEYTKALNYMLAEKTRKFVQRIGDTTIIFWAEHDNDLQQETISYSLFDNWNPDTSTISEKDIKAVLREASQGNHLVYDNKDISPQDRFFILGISPNAARLSVRFFCVSAFGRLIRNINEHQQRLEIAKPPWDAGKKLSMWSLLNETANQKSKNKQPPSPMAGALLMSLINGTEYPAAIYTQVLLRIRAEHTINWRKAAIIKAYQLNKKASTIPKEVLQVDFNDKTDYSPYVLGEIFALLEKIQEDAAGHDKKINSTIKDKYFNSACATPGRIFPLLLGLSVHHQKKLSDSSRKDYDAKLCNAMAKLGHRYPSHMNLDEQGAFYLGYYQKRQSMFSKKKES